MSITITEETLKRITWTDMREAAEAALKEGSSMELHLRSTKSGQPCDTLVVDNDTAGQCTGGTTAWGDWEPKTQTLKVDGMRINLDGEEVE